MTSGSTPRETHRPWTPEEVPLFEMVVLKRPILIDGQRQGAFIVGVRKRDGGILIQWMYRNAEIVDCQWLFENARLTNSETGIDTACGSPL